jgi:hypothetical protein
MCTVDVGVFGAVWVNTSVLNTFTDFNTKHICRDYDQVRAWAEARQIPKDIPDDYIDLPAPGTHILDHTP